MSQSSQVLRRRLRNLLRSFASFLFSLSGFLNVILFGFTRRGIIPYPSHVIKSRTRTKSSFASPGMTNNPMTDTVASVYSQTGTYGGRFSQFPTSDYPFELKDAPPLPALPPPSALHGQPRNMDDFHEVTFAKPNCAFSMDHQGAHEADLPQIHQVQRTRSGRLTGYDIPTRHDHTRFFSLSLAKVLCSRNDTGCSIAMPPVTCTISTI